MPSTLSPYVHEANVAFFKMLLDFDATEEERGELENLQFDSSIIPQGAANCSNAHELCKILGTPEETLAPTLEPWVLSDNSTGTALGPNGLVFPSGTQTNGKAAPFDPEDPLWAGILNYPAIQLLDGRLKDLVLCSSEYITDASKSKEGVVPDICRWFKADDGAVTRFVYPASIIYHVRKLFSSPLTEESLPVIRQIEAACRAVCAATTEAEDLTEELEALSDLALAIETKPADIKIDSEIFVQLRESLGGSQAEAEARVLVAFFQLSAALISWLMEEMKQYLKAEDRALVL